MINRLLKSLIWILAGAIVVYLFWLRFGDFVVNEQPVSPPCSEPVTFRVGEIDERFTITEPELGELIKSAVRVWSGAANSNLIAYSETEGISINLIYAEEQQLSDRERQYRDRLEQEEYSIASHEREYNRMNERYEEQMREYEQASQNLQRKIDRLNEWVVQKNQQGGFTEEDLRQYEQQKNEIEQTQSRLTQQEEMLKRRAAEINTKVDFLNEKIDSKNELVDSYNDMFAGERKFTQGAYEWKPGSWNINIFYFKDYAELKLVLVHEMGHALGMDHVSNPKSVMFELMGAQDRPDITLTGQDLQALRNLCGDHIN